MYYKVLKRTELGLISVTANYCFKVIYKEGEWAYPHEGSINAGYGLFVFEDEYPSWAEDKDPKYEVYECEIGEVLLLPKYRLTVGSLNIYRPESMNRLVSNYYPRDKGTALFSEVFTEAWPYHTVNTNKVKITKKVEVFEKRRADFNIN